LGRLLQQAGQAQDAEASFRQALQIDPDHLESLLCLGNTLSDLGRPQEAEACYRRALQIGLDHVQAHYSLGLLAMKHGLYEAASTEFLGVIALDPARDGAKINLCQAIYMLSAGNRELAKSLAGRARETCPQDPIILRGTAGMLGESIITTDEAIYTRELFDGFAQTFESTLGTIGYDIPAQLAEGLGLGSGEPAHGLDVLDAGCGTGLCAVHLRRVARTLVGVDLSPGMLRVAKQKNLYDALHESGVNDFLRRNPLAFDLIVFADVLVYFGDLREVIELSSGALRTQGRLAISVEAIERDAPGETHVLQPSGRYRHSPDYVQRSLEQAGLSIAKITACTVRMENGKAVPGRIVIANKR